jgi:RNA polymerase sigma factor (sigma-70 family)
MRLRNNRLRERRLLLGMTNTALAEAVGITKAIYGDLENMKMSPMSKKTGTWKPSVLRLADYFKVQPGELFPSVVFDVVVPVTEMTLDGEDVGLLMEQMQGALLSEARSEDQWSEEGLNAALETLTPREERVVKTYFGLTGDGGATCETIGESLEVTGARASQIIRRALRKLREPSRANRILNKTLLSDLEDESIVRCKHCNGTLTRKRPSDPFCCPCGLTKELS